MQIKTAPERGKPFTFTFLLHWSPDHNVPILNPYLARGVSDFLIRIRLTEPGDVRPAFPYDIAILREAIYNEFQDWKVVDLLVPEGSIVLLNKIPGYPDEAEEVIVNGELIGHRWYDPLTGKWRFRPIMHGAARMLEQKVGYYAIVDLPKLTRGYEIHRDRIVQAELPPKKGMLVVIQTRDGKWQGVARLVRSKRLYVLKAWRSVKPYYIETKCTIKDIIELNEAEIENKYEQARRFLYKLYERHGNTRRLVVSYSGGKDSLVVLDIADSVIRDKFEVLFNDTTLELPDTYKNVHEVSNFYGVDIHYARALTDFTKIIKLFYPPARDFRYCCKMLKLAPISMILKKIAPTGAVSIIGQRKFESSLRARLPQIAQSRWVANSLVAAPINNWTSLHVWLYILKLGLPYNKAYEKGFDRIGCWVCPANEIAEIELAKHWYPELYEWWCSLLEEVKVSLDLPDVWVRAGLWRWREKYPGDIRKYLELNVDDIQPDKILESYRKKITLVDIEQEGDKIKIMFRNVKKSKSEIIASLRTLFNTVDKIEKATMIELDESTHKLQLKLERGLKVDMKILFNGGTMYAYVDYILSKEHIVQTLRVFARAVYCTRCGLCISWCANHAIKFRQDGVEVIVEKCKRCNMCNIACPVAEYLITRSGLVAKIEKLVGTLARE